MKIHQISFQLRALLSISLLLLIATALIECDRQNAARRISNEPVFKSPCGKAKEVASRIGRCLDPVFELVEGRFSDPKGDQDIIGHCQRFNSTERCIRSAAKDCLTGLHKTATGAVASATNRFRKAECRSESSRARYIESLKCVRANAKQMEEIYKNNTNVAQAIRDLQVAPEVKLIKVCCLLNVVEKEIEQLFDPLCPRATPLILGIVHAMTDDARNTLCINPKCQGVLDGLLSKRSKEKQNFIEPFMEVLFELSTN